MRGGLNQTKDRRSEMNYFKGTLTALGIALAQGATANQLGLPEYTQTVTLDYASEADAAKAQLSACPLPFNRKIAFSARWDDSNTAHLKTQAAMAANGCKGTFYLNGPWSGTGAEYCKKLLESGCSVGAHTRTHPFLGEQNANEQFYEIMGNKVEREADSDSLISTLAFPFNQYASPFEKEVQLDVGKDMMNSGFLAVPTGYSYSLTLWKDLGYPQGTLAEAVLIVPGDRDTSVEKGVKDIETAMNKLPKFSANPCLTIGIHSWHTEEGLKNFAEVLRRHASRPDWWYCNQNEYGAYRFEANSCAISKKVEGKKAVFTISRVLPAELGASVPLWLKLEGAAPSKASENAKLVKEGDDSFLELPHTKETAFPSAIAFVENDKNASGAAAAAKATKIPFLSAALHANEATGELELLLKNEGKGELSDVKAAFRAPAGWDKGVVRQDAGKIAAGASRTIKASLGTRAKDMRYRLGRPYYVAQVDFVAEGKPFRLYATTRLAAQEPGSDCPLLSLATIVPLPDSVDLAKLSAPDADPASLGLKPQPANLEKSSPWALSFNTPKEKLPTGSFKTAALFDFEAPSGKELEISGSPDAQIYLNGVKVEKSGQAWKLNPAQGRNRLLAIYSNSDQRAQGKYIYWKGDVKFLKR